LPAVIRERVLAALGPRGIVAEVGDAESSIFGNIGLSLSYRRDAGYHVARATDPRLDGSRMSVSTTVRRFMQRHPIDQAAHEIKEALTVLTDRTWPES
jgi:hypothetical protein